MNLRRLCRVISKSRAVHPASRWKDSPCPYRSTCRRNFSSLTRFLPSTKHLATQLQANSCNNDWYSTDGSLTAGTGEGAGVGGESLSAAGGADGVGGAETGIKHPDAAEKAGGGAEIEEFIDYESEEEETEAWLPPIELKRGISGVFDIEELVTVLKEEKAKDLCVLKVPDHISFTDYLVVVSGMSMRHVRAIAENTKWLYKRKKLERDPFIRLHGIEACDWIAMDLGNIALHIFKPKVREVYDLEMLWSVGEKYDDQCQTEDDPYSYTFLESHYHH